MKHPRWGRVSVACVDRYLHRYDPAFQSAAVASDADSIEFESIGTVRSPRTPKHHDDWGDGESQIELDGAQFDQSALRGLDVFSHLEVIFFLHPLCEERIEWDRAIRATIRTGWT